MFIIFKKTGGNTTLTLFARLKTTLGLSGSSPPKQGSCFKMGQCFWMILLMAQCLVIQFGKEKRIFMLIYSFNLVICT